MPKESVAIFRLRISEKDRKSLKALQFLNRFMDEMKEDFGYRDDVLRAHKAIRFLSRNICEIEHE